MKKEDLKKLSLEELEEKDLKTGRSFSIMLGLIIVMFVAGLYQLFKLEHSPTTLLLAFCFLPLLLVLRKTNSAIKEQILVLQKEEVND